MKDPNKPKTKRAHVIIAELEPGKAARALVPAWRPNESLEIPVAALPAFILAGVPMPFSCYAQVNLHAQDAEALSFHAWEDLRNEHDRRLDDIIVDAKARAVRDEACDLLSTIFHDRQSGTWQIFDVGTHLEVTGVSNQLTRDAALALARDLIRAVIHRG